MSIAYGHLAMLPFDCMTLLNKDKTTYSD